MSHIIYRVTYLPHLNTAFPKYYIGSKYNWTEGMSYYGSVSSVQVFPYTEGITLKEWWKSRDPKDFLFEVIETFDEVSPTELVEIEREHQLELNVLGEQYFNQSVATMGFCSQPKSDETKRKIAEATARYWTSEAGQEKKRRLAERNSKTKSDELRQRWQDPEFRKNQIERYRKPKSEEHKRNIGLARRREIVYKGKVYLGWKELKEKTGLSKYMYKKVTSGDMNE